MESGLILAGGKGSRLGRDKALTPVAGKPMIRWVAETLEPLTDEVVTSVTPHAKVEEFRKILGKGAKIVPDRAGNRGPVEGLLSGLPAVEGDHLYLASCDTPFLTTKIYEVLKGEAYGKQGAVPKTDSIQPLIGYFRTTPLHKAALDVSYGSDQSPVAILKLMDVAYVGRKQLVSIDKDLLFQLNVNTPEDLRKAERIGRALLRKN